MNYFYFVMSCVVMLVGALTDVALILLAGALLAGGFLGREIERGAA